MAGQVRKFAAFHTEEYQRFVEVLVAARHQANLSQRDLAERLGIDPSIVAKYETRVRRIDVVELLKVLSALGLDPATFIADLAKRLNVTDG